jgi:hypothetical protein
MTPEQAYMADQEQREADYTVMEDWRSLIPHREVNHPHCRGYGVPGSNWNGRTQGNQPEDGRNPRAGLW